jgi:excisionase family DNA binding protein
LDIVEVVENYPVPLTVAKFAEIMGCSKDHIYELVKQGTLPAFRLGAKWLLDPHRTANWLRAQFNVPLAA